MNHKKTASHSTLAGYTLQKPQGRAVTSSRYQGSHLYNGWSAHQSDGYAASPGFWQPDWECSYTLQLRSEPVLSPVHSHSGDYSKPWIQPSARRVPVLQFYR